jgi:hypothetical protein
MNILKPVKELKKKTSHRKKIKHYYNFVTTVIFTMCLLLFL